jgi:hypothetical protein
MYYGTHRARTDYLPVSGPMHLYSTPLCNSISYVHLTQIPPSEVKFEFDMFFFWRHITRKSGKWFIFWNKCVPEEVSYEPTS